MRPFLYMLAFLGVIALGFWAYRENYATQASLREVRTLQREISLLHDAIAVQRAEWAYLNRPERLRELVGLNFDNLLLLPMEPGHFGTALNITYPVVEPVVSELEESLDLDAPLAGEEPPELAQSSSNAAIEEGL